MSLIDLEYIFNIRDHNAMDDRDLEVLVTRSTKELDFLPSSQCRMVLKFE
jgi:hypothetical protein